MTFPFCCCRSRSSETSFHASSKRYEESRKISQEIVKPAKKILVAEEVACVAGSPMGMKEMTNHHKNNKFETDTPKQTTRPLTEEQIKGTEVMTGKLAEIKKPAKPGAIEETEPGRKY